MAKEIKTSNKQDQKLIKAMKKRLQKIGTEEKLPPSQKPSFGPSKKFLEKKAMERKHRPEIKMDRQPPLERKKLLAVKGGGRAFNKGGKV